MRFVRFVSLVDVIVLVMTLFVLWLPPRSMTVAWAAKASDAERLALAAAEARAAVEPLDGALTAELARRLGAAGMEDWAVQAAARGANATPSSPSRWRALLATSVAYVERLEVKPALDYARRALAACGEARKLDERVCPSWEEVRMDFYATHLGAAVDSGIDPRRDPRGFRKAGEAGLRMMHIREPVNPPAPPEQSQPSQPSQPSQQSQPAPSPPAAVPVQAPTSP
jgi:hypothetical protein